MAFDTFDGPLRDPKNLCKQNLKILLEPIDFLRINLLRKLHYGPKTLEIHII